MAQSTEGNSLHVQDGYCDHISTILNARQHPIIVLEETAMQWMGAAVSSSENLDLLIKIDQLDGIIVDILATGEYERIEQNLRSRFNDPYVKQVPRLRHTGDHPFHDFCLSLWSEAVYMLKVAGQLVEVPDIFAWNRNVMEERFDPAAADVVSVSYQTLIKAGRQILSPVLAQRSQSKSSVYIPTIPRFIDSLLDQHRYRQTHPEVYKDTSLQGHTSVRFSLPSYNLTNLIRYLHLEKPHQREKLIPELAERNRADMEMRLNKYKRKPNMIPKGFLSSVPPSREKAVPVVGEGVRPFVSPANERHSKPDVP